jgi:membrane protein
MLRELQYWLKRIDRAIWTPHLAHLPVWKMRMLRAVRLVIVLFRDVVEGELTLWTMSLVYTTLLSMVPLLALSFSVLKAFGVHNQVRPLLQNLLAPLGDKGQEITTQLLGFIDHMNVGVLGAVGLALLLYTVISLMQKMEEAFNAIWHVTQLRSLGERFSRYLSTLLVGPILVFAAIGTTAMALNSAFMQDLVSIEPLGALVLGVTKLLPYALVIGAFTFFYLFVPNTRVRFLPALIAGAVGGILWQTAGWGFAVFVASSTHYAAIYSSFAILVLFLIWIYTSWLVLLIGADISFYVQNPEYLYAMLGEPRLSNRMRERLAIAVMQNVASHFVAGRPAWTLHQLTQQLAVPMHAVEVVLAALVEGDLLVETSHDPPAFLPPRDLAEMSVADILGMVRKAGEARFLNPDALALPRAVEDVVSQIEAAATAVAKGVSIRSLAGEGSADDEDPRLDAPAPHSVASARPGD